jgi:hypothetical protein
MSRKIEYEMTLQTQLDELRVEINRHNPRFGMKKIASESWNQEQIGLLLEKHRLTSNRLGDLRATSNHAWEELENGIALAWEPVRVVMEAIRKRFE